MASDPIRLAFALLIALSAFLAWRLASVDGDRDKWRTKAGEYEAPAKAIAEASKKGGAIGKIVAGQAKGEVDAGNERAADAARGSDDPIGAVAGSLRAEADRGRDKAAK